MNKFSQISVNILFKKMHSLLSWYVAVYWIFFGGYKYCKILCRLLWWCNFNWWYIS